jgi:hypothetical protein
LIEGGTEQPLGWLIFIFIILMIGIIIIVMNNSIQNIEKRPLYKSLIVFIIALILDAFIIPLIILLPGIYMVLSLSFRH